MLALKSKPKRKAAPSARIVRAKPAITPATGATQPGFGSVSLQAKLKIGEPNDKYEQEADRVADEVMRMPDSAITAAAGANSPDDPLHRSAAQPVSRIQRLCTECAEEETEKIQTKSLSSDWTPPRFALPRQEFDIQRQEIEDEDETVQSKRQNGVIQRQVMDETEEETVQTKPLSGIVQRACAECALEEKIQPKSFDSPVQRQATEEDEKFIQGKQEHGIRDIGVPASIQSGIDRLRQRGGRSLPESARAFMEPRFGRDFSRVRIHTNPDASNLTNSLSARAFTVGNDVFFGRGDFRPTAREGQRLLAHELTHTIQQAGMVVEPLQRVTADEHASGASSCDPEVASMPTPDAWSAEPYLNQVRNDEPGANRFLLGVRAEGDSVGLLQEALVAWGCALGLGNLLPEFGVDGLYGSETKVAVKTFQKTRNIDVDGIVGPIAMGELDMVVGAAASPPIETIGVPDSVAPGGMAEARALTATGDLAASPVEWRLEEAPAGSGIKDTVAPLTNVIAPATVGAESADATQSSSAIHFSAVNAATGKRVLASILVASSDDKKTKCPKDGSVRFFVHGIPVKKLVAEIALAVETVDGKPFARMQAKRFEAEKTVVTAKGSQSDLNDWEVGFSQTIHEDTVLHACYAPANDPAKDPRKKPKQTKTGMHVQHIGTLAGGPVLDGGETSSNPPFYGDPDLPALPDTKKGPVVAIDDQPETSAPIFFDNDPSTGACLTKMIRLFDATAFVIARRKDGETCFLWHINWGFLQTASPGEIAVDAGGNARIGNFSLNFAQFPIEEGAGHGGRPRKLVPPLANSFGKKDETKNLAKPCPKTGGGCVSEPKPPKPPRVKITPVAPTVHGVRRIPPDDEKEIKVTVSGFDPAIDPSIDLRQQRPDASGGVTLNGKSKIRLKNGSRRVRVKGILQTTPGRKPQRLAARQAGKTLARSAPFFVAAWPEKVSIAFKKELKGKPLPIASAPPGLFWGIQYDTRFFCETGTQSDCDQTTYMEIIKKTDSSGALRGKTHKQSSFLPFTTQPNPDFHVSGHANRTDFIDALFNFWAVKTQNSSKASQHFVFGDKRTGIPSKAATKAGNPVIPKSGFRVGMKVIRVGGHIPPGSLLDKSEDWILLVGKVGKAFGKVKVAAGGGGGTLRSVDI